MGTPGSYKACRAILETTFLASKETLKIKCKAIQGDAVKFRIIQEYKYLPSIKNDYTYVVGDMSALNWDEVIADFHHIQSWGSTLNHCSKATIAL